MNFTKTKFSFLLLFCLLAWVCTQAQSVGKVGSNSMNINSSAVFEIESTTKGLLLPRMTQAQMNSIVNPVEGLVVYCTNCTIKGVLVYNGAWVNLIDIVPEPTVVGAGGKVWMDRNLGATQVAVSSSDAASYGDLYQWGRGSDGHQLRTSGTTSTLSSSDQPGHANFISTSSSPNDWRSPQNNVLWQGVSGVNNPCPSGFRVPTESELNTERASWVSQDAAGAFGSALKLPMAGSRFNSNGSLNSVGGFGYYWSSTVSGALVSFGYFYSSNASMGTNYRANGFSVRCIKD